MNKAFFPFKKVLAGALLAFGVFAVFPNAVSAYFFEAESSEANALEASRLDLVEESVRDGKEALSTLKPSVESLGLTYAVSGAVSSSTANFCGDLVVAVEQNGQQIFEGKPADFTASGALSVSEQDTFDYEFSTNVANGNYADETCIVSFDFQASQENQNYGEAFYDREEASFTLIGANFTTEEAAVTPPPALEPDGNLEISEIMFDPGEYGTSSSDTDREWVEVRNGSTSAVDLTEWVLAEDGTDHGIDSFAGSAVIPAGGFAVIADDAATFASEYPDVNAPVFDSSFSLPNTSNTLVLKNASGTAIDTKSYDETQETDNGHSVQFVAGNACVAEATPGAANDCGADTAISDSSPEKTLNSEGSRDSENTESASSSPSAQTNASSTDEKTQEQEGDATSSAERENLEKEKVISEDENVAASEEGELQQEDQVSSSEETPGPEEEVVQADKDQDESEAPTTEEVDEGSEAGGDGGDENTTPSE